MGGSRTFHVSGVSTHKMKGHTVRVKVWRDDNIKGFGSYLSPSIKEGRHGKVLLNIEATFHAAADLNHNPKDLLVEIVMHEVGHAMEEYLNKRFSEKRIERIVRAYKKKYHLPPRKRRT